MAARPTDVEEQVRALHERGALEEAATLLLETYGRELRSYLAAVARAPDLAAEGYAQLCEDLWRGLPGFGFRASARTWLYTLARHALARVARDPQRRRERNLPLSTIAHLEREEARVRLETAAYRRTTMKDRVRALREQLSSDDRELLILRVDRGLDWLEVARILSDEDPDSTLLRRRATALRKRFERLKARLRELAIAEGLVRGDGEPA